MAWGFSLVSAANLHLMLAYDNCSFFEQAIPYPPYEYGMHDVIRTQPDGYVYAPEKPGLGLDVDCGHGSCDVACVRCGRARLTM